MRIFDEKSIHGIFQRIGGVYELGKREGAIHQLHKSYSSQSEAVYHLVDK